ncbi:MAG: thioredoxin domain-containing protein [Gammaproteobacteria bacterium]|nr:thioredoxin domain-containing protein [Gammaproteobacteria bacterium]
MQVFRLSAIGLSLLGVVLTPVALAVETIDWHHWEIEAFERAKAEDKIILVSVGMEGCAACGRMEALTYTDSGVIGRINKSFIAIEVDAEARPDIGERYSDWAWPATIFMAPDATQVLAIRGNRLPRNFNPILDDLVAKQAAGRLEADPNSPYAAPPAPAATELTRVRDDLRVQLDRSLNRKYGGWGRSGIGGEQSGSRLRHLYMRAHMYDDAELEELALKGSAGFLNALDPVWGGVYSASFPADMDVPERFAGLRAIPEKRILVQSNALTAFALGYEKTAEDRYRAGIVEVDRYLRHWMMAPDGTFYTNQKSEPPNLPSGMSKQDYWLLDSDAKRRAYGLPPVDHAVYTDKNGEVITAYVLAYEATGNDAYLTTAKKAARAILQKRRRADGWVVQALPNDAADKDARMRPLVTDEKPFLSAQVWFGTALLALHRASGDPEWLAAADGIGKATLEQLHDDKVGGFFATAADATAAIIAPRKPFEGNGTAASFYYDLWLYTKDDIYAGIAEDAVRAVGQPGIIRREGRIAGEFAIALEKVTTKYVEFSVVGDRTHPNAKALFDAGLAVFEPRKALHYEAPGRYPDRGIPSMYICNPDMCTIPITEPAEVGKQAVAFRAPANSG